MSIETWDFGKTIDGTPVKGYTVTNQNGIAIKVIEYGAYLTSCKTPDREGTIEEITLGYSTLKEYETHNGYLGATVGRWANRIKSGQFTLNGTTYNLPKNNGKNHLHGGPQGLSQQVWKSEIIQGANWEGVSFSVYSPDGAEGYPGNLQLTVHYRLTDSNELIFEYLGEVDRPTPVNITNHAYWNLNGAPERSPLNHRIQINGNATLELDNELIPTGKVISLDNNPYDLRTPTLLKDAPKSGFDAFYVLDGQQPAAKAYSPDSGRMLTMKTDAQGIQFYTASQMEAREVQNGVAGPGSAFCFEPGAYNDSVNNENFPQSIATPENPYRQKTVILFSVE